MAWLRLTSSILMTSGWISFVLLSSSNAAITVVATSWSSLPLSYQKSFLHFSLPIERILLNYVSPLDILISAATGNRLSFWSFGRRRIAWGNYFSISVPTVHSGVMLDLRSLRSIFCSFLAICICIAFNLAFLRDVATKAIDSLLSIAGCIHRNGFSVFCIPTKLCLIRGIDINFT